MLYLTIQHLGKFISLFHKNSFNKATAIFKAINIIAPIVKSTIKLTIKQTALKQKQGKPTAKIATRPLNKN